MTTTPTPSPSDLAPCPFCAAGTTQMQENGRMWTGQRMSEPVSVSVVHWCEPVDGQPSRRIERVGRDHASAVGAWNTRAALATSAAGEPVAGQFEAQAVLMAGVGALVRVTTDHEPGGPFETLIEELEPWAEKLDAGFGTATPDGEAEAVAFIRKAIHYVGGPFGLDAAPPAPERAERATHQQSLQVAAERVIQARNVYGWGQEADDAIAAMYGVLQGHGIKGDTA